MKNLALILTSITILLVTQGFSQINYDKAYSLTVCTQSRDAICDLFIENKSDNKFTGIIVVDGVAQEIFGWYTFKASVSPYYQNGFAFYRKVDASFEHQILYKGTFNHDMSIIIGEMFYYGMEMGFYGTEKTITAISQKNPVSKSEVILYPNPVSSILNIYKTDKNFKTIEIFDSSGKIVFECGYTNQINLSNLNPGIYILKLIDDQQESQSFQFIKENSF